MYIESPQNPKIRLWSSLKTKKGRTAEKMYIAEGIRLVQEALTFTQEVQAVLWDAGTDELPLELRESLHSKRIPCYELSPSAFASVSDTVTSQGVIAVISAPERLDSLPPGERVLLLDGIQDPGNVGTLLRAADAFGFREVCCGTHTVDPFSPKVVRASMGGLFRVSVVSEDSVRYIQRWLTHCPNGVVAASSADAKRSASESPFGGALLLCIGSEAHGVSESVSELATHSVCIPMEPQTESLNAAMAGTILMYEAYNQSR